MAIYPVTLAMANHSCWPSAVRVDPPATSLEPPANATNAASLSYRALEALPAGTEVSQSCELTSNLPLLARDFMGTFVQIACDSRRRRRLAAEVSTHKHSAVACDLWL